MNTNTMPKTVNQVRAEYAKERQSLDAELRAIKNDPKLTNEQKLDRITDFDGRRKMLAAREREAIRQATVTPHPISAERMNEIRQTFGLPPAAGSNRSVS